MPFTKSGQAVLNLMSSPVRGKADSFSRDLVATGCTSGSKAASLSQLLAPWAKSCLPYRGLAAHGSLSLPHR